MRESEVSIRGRVLREMIAHTTNDLSIGKKLKSGEIQKRLGTTEPPWKCPDCFIMETIEMENFTMELLSAKEGA
ncbi:MAG: alpha/beta hydrolase, partial [Roseburia sp.]|nr:alpha/beta hydrolase [Roseburia sp.]